MDTTLKMHQRSFKTLSVREAPTDSGYIGILDGYASIFDVDSLQMGVSWDSNLPIFEQVAKGAFTKSLAEKPDVRALWQHKSSEPIGRAPDTLKISEDDKGLKVEIYLIDTTAHRDILQMVRNKIVDAMSIGFYTIKESFETLEDRVLWRQEEVELIEVSIVTWPAYPDTSIEARSKIVNDHYAKFRSSNPVPEQHVPLSILRERLQLSRLIVS